VEKFFVRFATKLLAEVFQSLHFTSLHVVLHEKTTEKFSMSFSISAHHEAFEQFRIGISSSSQGVEAMSKTNVMMSRNTFRHSPFGISFSRNFHILASTARLST
jgi:hypothetical protein